MVDLPFLEEVVALVIDDDECREVHDVDLPHGLHAEFRILQHLHLLDAVLRQDRRRPANGPQVEAPVRLARVGHLGRVSMYYATEIVADKRTALLRLPFASEINEPPAFMKLSTYESMRPAVVGPNDPDAIPVGVLAGPAGMAL